MRSKAKLAVLGGVVLLLAACGPASEATSTPPPAATKAPTNVATATPAPALATPRAAASPTPVASPTPSRTSAVTPKLGGTVSQYLRRDPTSFDTHLIGWEIQTRQIHALVYNQLMDHPWPDEGNCAIQDIRPDLAERWQWLDDTTLEVKLRPGVKFQDKAPVGGREIVADDVVFSLSRAQRGATPLTALQLIKRMEATDRYTVRFQTDGPPPALIPAGLAVSPGSHILPKEAGGAKQEWNRPEAIVGTGPFELVRYLPGVRVDFKKNPTYWKSGLPYVDEVRAYPMPDSSTRVSALRSGKLDIVMEVPAPFSAELKKTNPEIRQVDCAYIWGFMALYMRNDKPPFNDIRLRRAVSMAIDQNTIIEKLYLGRGFRSGVAHVPVLEAMKVEEFPSDVRKYFEFHPDESRKLLADAGFAKGLKLSLPVSAGYGSPYNETYEIVLAMLKDVGIEASLDMQLYAEHIKTASAGIYDQAYIGKTGEVNIYDIFSNVHSKTAFDRNRGHVNDPVIDKLIEEFMRTTDAGKARALSVQIQSRMADQVYRLLLPNISTIHAYSPRIQNYGTGGDISQTRALYERIWVKD